MKKLEKNGWEVYWKDNDFDRELKGLKCFSDTLINAYGIEGNVETKKELDLFLKKCKTDNLIVAIYQKSISAECNPHDDMPYTYVKIYYYEKEND